MAVCHVDHILALAGKLYTGNLHSGLIVKRFIELVKQNLSDPRMNVNSLCDTLGVHRATLSRRFREAMHRPPGDFIAKNRVLRGMTLLRGTDLAISEIALQCGILDPGLFCRAIRRETGMNPSEYRTSVLHRRELD